MKPFVGIFVFCILAGCAAPSSDTEGMAHTVAYVTDQSFEVEVMQASVPVLVDFTAVWCGPCKEVDPVVESLVSEMGDRAKIVKVDIDQSPGIYADLRVNGVPTIVFFNNGREEDRISSPQSKETYVKYLETMIGGESALDATLELLEFDSFRRHYLDTKAVAEIEAMLPQRPDLLSEPFENGQTPLSLILDHPSVRQNELVALSLANHATLTSYNLVGLGKCDELKEAIEKDPEVANRPDPDGASPLFVALTRAHRLENGGCLRTLLDLGADPSLARSERYHVATSVVFANDLSLLAEFLDRGLDPEFGDRNGQNALHIAASFAYVDQVRLLLKRGVNQQLETDQGQTAFDLVYESSQSGEKKVAESDSPEVKEYYVERLKALKQIMALLEGAQSL